MNNRLWLAGVFQFKIKNKNRQLKGCFIFPKGILLG